MYAIEKDGVYEFLFDKEHKGSTKKGESLDYRGTIDGEGKLYLDEEGNVSVCISNDTYYVYKNYNSGIIVGDKKTGNCIIGFDALTNKYVAMLDNGTGNVSNVYSKDEVNNLVDAKATELDTKITNNTNEITNMKSNIEELQNNLNNYALQSELDKTNTNVENLSSLVNTNQKNIDSINNKLLSKKIVVLKNISKLPADKESWNLSDSYANYDQIIVSYKNSETGVMSNALLFPNLTENYTLWLSSIPNVYDQCGYLIFNGNTVTYYKSCNNNPYIKAIYGQKF